MIRLAHVMMVSVPCLGNGQTVLVKTIFLLVAVRCKDTRIAVQVRTNKPFNGRIYALGRSETCNIDVINSDEFRLDLTMGGQDCNTQSVVGFLIKFTFAITLTIWLCILFV